MTCFRGEDPLRVGMGKRTLVERDHLPSHVARGIEAEKSLASFPGLPRSSCRVLQHLHDSSRQWGWIPHRNKSCTSIATGHLADGREVRSHDGGLQGHGFQHHRSKPLPAGWQAEHIRGGEQIWNVATRSKETHGFLHTEVLNKRPEGRGVVAFAASNDQLHGGQFMSDNTERPQEYVQSLLVLLARRGDDQWGFRLYAYRGTCSVPTLLCTGPKLFGISTPGDDVDLAQGNDKSPGHDSSQMLRERMETDNSSGADDVGCLDRPNLPRVQSRITDLLAPVRNVDQAGNDRDAREGTGDSAGKIGLEECRMEEVRTAARKKTGDPSDALEATTFASQVEKLGSGREQVVLEARMIVQKRHIQTEARSDEVRGHGRKRPLSTSGNQAINQVEKMHGRVQAPLSAAAAGFARGAVGA